jgi:hypothetical protein
MLGYIAVGDYDNNSKLEFALASGINDSLYVFETVSNNSFRLKFKTYTGLKNQYSVITGNDLDNDGKKEIFVSGDNFNQQGYRNVKMYEASSGDLFSLNCTITQYTGLVGIQPIASGNILNSGFDELVLEAHRIFIYGSAGNDVFALRDSSLNFNNATNAFCHDISPGNLNELQILRANSSTLIFENPAITGLGGVNENAGEFILYQNYPNPFNPTTVVSFQLPVFSYVRVVIFDILGRHVETIHESSLQPGTYEVSWDAANYPSGVYFYQLSVSSEQLIRQSPDYIETKKMMLLR